MSEPAPLASIGWAAPRGMVTLRGDFASRAFRAAAEAVGAADFPEPRQIHLAESRGLAWMSPDELLLFTPPADATAAVEALTARLAGEAHLVTDVSDARAILTITGPSAREVLAKGAPVDLAPGRFEPGEIRRTRLGQVAAAFWMADARTFELICFRSVAGFVEDWLRHAARGGSGAGLFPEV